MEPDWDDYEQLAVWNMLNLVCHIQMIAVLRRRKDNPSAALLCFDMVLTSAVPDGRDRWQRLP